MTGVQTCALPISPANASVNLDISSPDCNIILNQDEPERYFIQKIISSDNPNIPKGNGIYTIYIGDNHSEEVPEGKISFSLIEKGLIKHSTSAINIKKSDISSYVKSFGFKAAQNDFLSKDYYGSLHGDSLFITIPEYCDIRDLIPSFEINCEALLLDNKIIESETTSVNFKNKSLTFDIITFDGDKQSINVIVKTFTGLPTLFIHTDKGEPVLTKENYIKAKMNIDGAGSFDDIDDIDLSIRCRGNSTFSYPKKPYALKLDDKISILGKPAHKRWVLLANWMDRPLLRNRISLKVAEKTGLAWTPGSEFVEVVLNGVHLGNYLLCEQIKIDKNRVNISSLKPSHISLPEIS